MPSEIDAWEPLRDKIIGLGEGSFRKSYYPELQRKLADLEQFRALLDQSNDSIFLINVDGGRIADVSGSACRQLNYVREALLRMTIFDLVDESAARMIESLFAGKANRMNLITTIGDRNGVRTPCEISFNIVRLNDKVFAVAAARDITDRERIAGELKRSEDTYQTIFNSVNDGIVILDPASGKALDINDALCQMLGCDRKEALSIGLTEILSTDQSYSLEKILKQFNDLITEGPKLYQIHIKARNGGVFWAEINLKRTIIRGEDRVLAVVRDTTERKLAEEQIKTSLHEKEVMLKEIHHRVKNNLQVISSLLSVQSKYLIDRHDVDLFRESQDRVKSMALVHEKLYQSNDLAYIDFPSYIDRLATNLFRSYGGGSGNIKLFMDVADVKLNVDTAIPCGLIVNELVTNSLKYAFPDNRNGTISIILRPENGQCLLEVSDDGIGIPENFRIDNSNSLGLQLVTMLSSQLDGTIAIDVTKGTRFTILFKKA